MLMSGAASGNLLVLNYGWASFGNHSWRKSWFKWLPISHIPRIGRSLAVRTLTDARI